MTRRLLMTADAVGGVWQYAIELATALRPAGYAVELAILGPPAGPAQVAAADAAGVALIDTGLPLDWLSTDPAMVETTGQALADLAAARGAQIVQLNQPAFAGAPFGVPVVAVAHSCVASWWDAVEDGPLPPDLAWQTALTRRGFARADALVCPTAAFAGTVQRLYGLPRRPDVVHNGRTAGTPTAAVHDFAFTAGRLWDRGKNVATLDRAAARLSVPFKAAGPVAGPHGERIALAHLSPLGRLDDRAVADCLAARPVFVSAARYEPFGLAVLEAGLAGCALVLSDIPTFRELWDGVATFVDPDDDRGFAVAIDMLAGDVALRLARGDQARRRAADYAPAPMAAGMAAIYDRLLGAGERVAA